MLFVLNYTGSTVVDNEKMYANEVIVVSVYMYN